jgi:hypothetical protein
MITADSLLRYHIQLSAAAGALPARRISALGSPYTSIDIFPRLSPGCSTISSMSVRKIGAAPVLMSGSL